MLYAAVHSRVTEVNLGGLGQELALPVTRSSSTIWPVEGRQRKCLWKILSLSLPWALCGHVELK